MHQRAVPRSPSKGFDSAGFDTGAVEVNLNGTLDVTFEEGGLVVIEALNESVTEVGLLLDRGVAEFLPLP
jgi:hypothetical protein